MCYIGIGGDYMASERSFNLRLGDLYDTVFQRVVEESRKKGRVVSMAEWIKRAIKEKLAREE